MIEGDRRGHTSPRGGVYWEDQTYSDRRSLLYIPRGFDPRRPALMVVFFHGNEATLTRDVRNRQQVPRQVAESGLNAVLVAPQFAVNALELERGPILGAGRVSGVSQGGDRAAGGAHGDGVRAQRFFDAPVVIVAYSGGYNPAAFILHAGKVDDRLRGMILLDALYAEIDKFADWLARRPPAFFVSAYGKPARDENVALQRHADRARRALSIGLAGHSRARQRVVHRRQRRDQARRFHDAGLGRRPAQGPVAPDRRLRAPGAAFRPVRAEEALNFG